MRLSHSLIQLRKKKNQTNKHNKTNIHVILAFYLDANFYKDIFVGLAKSSIAMS